MAQTVRSSGSLPRSLLLLDRRAVTPILLALLVPLLGSVVLSTLIGPTRWVHGLAHTALEAAGAAIALVVAAVLVLERSGSRGEAPHLAWVSLALTCMGILDLFHSMVEFSPAFYWSRTIGNLLGGLLFMGVWLPDSVATHRHFRFAPLAVAAASLALGGYFILRPDALPLMFAGQGYTMTAKVINLTGGLAFLLAGWNFLVRYGQTKKPENHLFGLHCAIFGMAGVLFAFSSLWNAVWWFFHLLRLLAYSVVIKYLVQRYQEALRMTESRLSLAVDHAGVGFFDWDVPANQLVFSQRMSDDWGIDRAGQGETLEEALALVHPGDLPRVRDLVERALRERAPYRTEYRVRRPDGSIVWVESSASVTFDKAGAPLRLFGTSLDVTYRKQAEETLRVERDKFQAVLDNAEVGIGLSDASGKILLLNPAGLAIHGFRSADEMFSALDRYTEEFELRRFDGTRIPIEEWPVSRAMRGDYVRNHDIRLWRRSTGEERFLSYSVAPVRDESGVPLSFVFSIADITQRTRAEAELTRTSEVLNAIMQSSSDVIFVKDRASRMVYCNPRTLSLIGRSADEIYGKNDVEFLGPGKGGEEILKTDERIMSTGVGETVEEWVTWQDGARRLYMSRKEAHRNDAGEVIGLIGISRDITDLKQVQERLEDAVRARDEFVSIASHELKTPLTSLLLQIQLRQRALRRGDPSACAPERVQSLLDQSEKQSLRLGRLVDDMLDVSRIRSGSLTIQRERFDLGDLARDVIDRLRHQFASEGCELPTLTRSPGAVGAWDRMRIEQVITNLLTNAIRYGKKRPIAVRVSCTDRTVLLEVEDHGLGIPVEAREKIFDRFERAISANEVSGLGLGLFITRQIVLAHGGRVWVDSTVGEGSTFSVELPREAEPQ